MPIRAKNNKREDAMAEERGADQVVEVAVDGYRIVTYSFGSGAGGEVISLRERP